MINKKLAILSMTDNIKQQMERREEFKQDLLLECPFKIEERIKLVNLNTGVERFVFIKRIYVTDSGDYVFKLFHMVNKSYGIVQQETEIGFMEIVEKCEQIKTINHDRTKQRFNRSN